MSGVTICVPTIGRPEIAGCLSSLAEQTAVEDRVLVVCDRPRRFDWVALLVEGLRRQGAQGRWTVWNRDNLGHFGHVARNEALDHLASLEDAPEWFWSCDDDDVPTPDALKRIRSAADSGDADWYVFQMVGGTDSHFDDVTIPNRGEYVIPGNIGTPMIVGPVSCASRFGLNPRTEFGRNWEPGYFGDLEFAVALREELGDPVWVDETLAVIRPAPVVPSMLAP